MLEQVPEALGRAVLPFLLNDAGNALCEAELWLLTEYRSFDLDHFPRDTAARFADPVNVGDAARQGLDEALRLGGSMSPPLIAYARAGTRLAPEHAEAIRTFFGSAIGQRWLAARTAAFKITRGRYGAFEREASARGYRVAAGKLEELLLPDARYDESPGTSGR